MVVDIAHPGLVPGTGAFRRALAGLFMAGLATFALLYVVQPLLPLLGRAFTQDATTTSFALSVTTLTLALAVVPMAWASERFGRAVVLNLSLLVATVLGISSAFAPHWWVLLVLRALEGVALAGVPASALAWINDEIHPRHISFASGLYIAGTSVGGMVGRLLSGGLATWWGWQGAVLGVGGLSLACAIAAKFLLPASPRRSRQPTTSRTEVAGRRSFRRTRLYLVGGLSMAAFVGIYNVLAYRLEAAPYLLSPGAASLVFLAYLTGTLSSARAGRVATRFGIRWTMAGGLLFAVVGVALTLASALPVLVLGVCLLTAGFFLAHSVASGQAPVGAGNPSLAAGRYVLFYYLGSSIGGPLLGAAYAVGGWVATAAAAVILLIVAAITAPPGQTRIRPGSADHARRTGADDSAS